MKCPMCVVKKANHSCDHPGVNDAVPPEDIITLILDICILNISMHKENTKYVLIYLFPKHLLREKVFVPFSNQIMSLAQ